MYLVYSLALFLLFLALLPYFAYQAIKHGKYYESFRQRLGSLPAGLRGKGEPCVWIHAVSVGEFLAAEPFIAALRGRFPGFRVVVSTTTATGQRLAASRLGSASEPEKDKILGVFYFPFDWAFAVGRTIDHVAPSAVIILETEIWPNFLRECARRRIPVAMVNGRISDRSYRGYCRFRGFFRRVLQDVSILVMQSQDDADRIISLGANPERVHVCGNLKYDVADPDTRPGDPRRAELERLLGPCKSADLLVAGSTAPGEERMLLWALQQIRGVRGLENTRMLIAPRRPERFSEVAALIAGAGLKFIKRSEFGEGLTGPHLRPDVVLLDTMGELAAVYRFASVVFVGGSLVARGGHNILEPALYAKPIVVGPYTNNFRQMVRDFVEERAAIQIQIPKDPRASLASELARELIHLLSAKQEAIEMGARAREVLLKNRGAATRTLAAIEPLLVEAQTVPAVARNRVASKDSL